MAGPRVYFSRPSWNSWHRDRMWPLEEDTNNHPTCPNTRHHPYHHSSNSEVHWVRVDCKNWRYPFLNPLTALFLTIPSTFNKQLLAGWWKEKRWPKNQTLERPEWHHQEHLTQRWQLWRCSWSHNRNSQVAAEALTTETGKPFTFGKPAQALGRKVYASNIASHPEIQFHKHPICGILKKLICQFLPVDV